MRLSPDPRCRPPGFIQAFQEAASAPIKPLNEKRKNRRRPRQSHHYHAATHPRCTKCARETAAGKLWQLRNRIRLESNPRGRSRREYNKSSNRPLVPTRAEESSKKNRRSHAPMEGLVFLTTARRLVVIGGPGDPPRQGVGVKPEAQKSPARRYRKRGQ